MVKLCLLFSGNVMMNAGARCMYNYIHSTYIDFVYNSVFKKQHLLTRPFLQAPVSHHMEEDSMSSRLHWCSDLFPTVCIFGSCMSNVKTGPLLNGHLVGGVPYPSVQIYSCVSFFSFAVVFAASIFYLFWRHTQFCLDMLGWIILEFKSTSRVNGWTKTLEQSAGYDSFEFEIPTSLSRKLTFQGGQVLMEVSQGKQLWSSSFW